MKKTTMTMLVLIILSSVILTACGGDDCEDTAVFGVNPVRVEITIGSNSRSYKALTYAEKGGDDYTPQYDAYMCSIHSEYAADREGFLDDGYKYSCNNLGQFTRYDYRIGCTSTYSTDCNVDGNDAKLGQTEYRNPTQVYQDVVQTQANWLKEFEGHEDRLAGATSYGEVTATGVTAGMTQAEIVAYVASHPLEQPEGEEAEDPGLDYALLIADFNPDKDQRMCEASSNCNSEWLNQSGVFSDSSGDSNYCCGDDVFDVGYVKDISGTPYVCVQQPNGKYEWLNPHDQSSKYTPQADGDHKVFGDIFTMFAPEYYAVETEEIDDVFYLKNKTGYPVRAEILSDGTQWRMCRADGTSFHGSSAYVSYVAPGQMVQITAPDSSVRDYLCNDFTLQSGLHGARFAECYYGAPLNGYSYTSPTSIWSSFSGSYSNALRPIASFELWPSIYESWPTFTDTYLTADFNTVSRAGSKALRLQLKVNGSAAVPAQQINQTTIPFEVSHSSSVAGSLEGDIRSSTTAGLNIVVNDISYPIEAYLVKHQVKDAYVHFVIPNLNAPITSLSFQLISSNLNYKSNATYTLYVDNLNFVQTGRTAYCGAVGGKSTWITSRDYSKESCSGIGGTHTGSKCCGDTKGEYYVDLNASCWNSYPVNVGARFALPRVKINGITFDFFCSDNPTTCEHIVPRLPSTAAVTDAIFVVDSLNSTTFNVSFKQSKNVSTNISTDTLVFNIKKYEYIGFNSSIRYCGNSTPANPIASAVPYVTNPSGSTACVLNDQFYCSAAGGWVNTANMEYRDNPNATTPRDGDGGGDIPFVSERQYLRSVPAQFVQNVSQPYECCPADYCWNGAKCVEDYSNEPFKDPGNFSINNNGDGYRCVNGTWNLSYRKFHPYTRDYGYCAQDSQCFVSQTGNYSQNNLNGSNPQCVGNTQTIGDYFCEIGNWSTRTKYLASAMKERGSGDYSIYCDAYTEVLNYVSGTIQGKSVASYITGNYATCTVNITNFGQIPCMNNFCVYLDSNDQVAFGTTLNQQITGNMSLAELFNISCSRPTGSGLQKCETNSLWYYDPDKKIAVYSPTKSFGTGSVLDQIVSLFVDLRNWLLGTSQTGLSLNYPPVPQDISYIENDQKYDKLLYMSDSYDGRRREIYGVRGSTFSDNASISGPIGYIAVEYNQFSFNNNDPKLRDVCSYVNSTIDWKATQFVCLKQSSKYYVFAESDSATLFQDLTAKLRLLK